MKNRDWYKQVKDVLYYLSKIFSWACFLILFSVAAFFIYYTIEARSYAKKGLEHQPKMSLYSILTGSMEPNIRVDDVIFTLRVNAPEDLKAGDVITFVSENPHTRGTIITHRISEVRRVGDEYAFHTKGDANPVEDNVPVTFNNIIGKVVVKFPKLGILKKIVSNRVGWILLVLFPALGIIIYDSLRVAKTMKLNKTSILISDQKKKPDIKDTSDLKERLLKKQLSYQDIKETDMPKLRN